jgi:fatty acid desaturase
MSLYLDATQRQQIHHLRTSWRSHTEWPTWLLIATIYSAWFGTALHARALGLPLATCMLAVLSCWYMSLQHELLHGHPTRFPILNAALGFAPLAVWFPYAVYRESHLRHHIDANLTDPHLDPESYFVSTHQWNQAGPVIRCLLAWRNTLIGRVLIGPCFSIAAALRRAAGEIAGGNVRVAAHWTAHLLALVTLAFWLDRHCGISPVLFIVGIGYPALALGAVRSFQEHREAADVAQRTVINEAALPWRLLFLNNNLHVVHHDLPGLPWFILPAVYRQRRDAYIARNGGFVAEGYSEWLSRYAFTPVAHPLRTGADPVLVEDALPSSWSSDTTQAAS